MAATPVSPAHSPPPRGEPALNVHAERSRLTAEQLQRWRGLPLCWVDAMPRVDTRDIAHPSPVLAMLDTGMAEAEFSFDDRTQRHDICAGTMGLFVQPLTRRSRWLTRRASRIMLELDADWLADHGFGGAGEWPALQQQLAFRDDELAAVLRAAASEIAAGCPHGALYAESLSMGVALRLSQRHAQGRPAARERGRLTPDQWQRVVDLVHQRLAEPLALADLAAAAGFSAPHFVRLMRNTAGTTPHRFVQAQRVERAHALLREGRLPLADVAAATGFATQSHMTTALRRALGFTPGDIRRASMLQAARRGA